MDYNYRIFACAAIGEIGNGRSMRVKLIWSFLGTLIALEISLKQIKKNLMPCFAGFKMRILVDKINSPVIPRQLNKYDILSSKQSFRIRPDSGLIKTIGQFWNLNISQLERPRRCN